MGDSIASIAVTTAYLHIEVIECVSSAWSKMKPSVASEPASIIDGYYLEEPWHKLEFQNEYSVNQVFTWDMSEGGSSQESSN